jgi:hypothetical protein
MKFILDTLYSWFPIILTVSNDLTPLIFNISKLNCVKSKNW